MVLGVIFAVMKMGLMVARVSRAELSDILRGAGATFLRVEFVLIVAALWTVPVGVAVGLRPKLASFAMSGAINWIGTWYKPSGPLSGLEIASHFSHLLTEGLRARPAASRRSSKTAAKTARSMR